jgi:hypothetical protein
MVPEMSLLELRCSCVRHENDADEIQCRFAVFIRLLNDMTLDEASM